MPIFAVPIAEIAQLVEHDLAKVGVASSSLVFRSKEVIRNDGLFSYVSMSYARQTYLGRCSGCICDFSESGWISGKMRLISGECLPLHLPQSLPLSV